MVIGRTDVGGFVFWGKEGGSVCLGRNSKLAIKIGGFAVVVVDNEF